MGKERLFRFKLFEVSHGQSALPIGMDAVLIGAWADVTNARRILDAGTGCGVIALMCAQRCPEANVTGIDVHRPSIIEATGNFKSSPWSKRLNALCTDFNYIAEASAYNRFQTRDKADDSILSGTYDLIISNPPFFNSGVDTDGNTDARLVARHSGSFGPAKLITSGARLLSCTGSIATIFPTEQTEYLLLKCREAGLQVLRLCNVVSRPGTPAKRTMLQAGIRRPDDVPDMEICTETTLCIYTDKGEYSEEYKSLTHDFYLKF